MRNAKPKDTIAVSHGADTLTWEQLERNANRRARAFAAKGVKPGDFVAIGLPNSNVFFETTFAVWKCGATPTSLTWRLPRGEAAAVLDILKPSLVVGGQPDWNAPNSLPADFVPEGFSDAPIDNPVARYWKAMTSGGSTGRPKVILDHQPAVVDTAAPSALGIPQGASLLNPGPLYHNAPFIVAHTALFNGGRVSGLVKFDAEETLRLIEAEPRAVGQLRADHDAPDLVAAGRGAQPLRRVKPADRIPHGGADAALAEGKVDRVAGTRSGSTNSMAAPSGRAPRSFPAPNG